MPRLTDVDRRTLIASGLGLGTLGTLTAVMVPFRDGLSEATPALVLVLPVVGAAALGGPLAGLACAIGGFLLYDIVFIPPYDTLTVGSGQGWVALVVYLVVVLLVANLITTLTRARTEARRHEADTSRLADLTERLIPERPLPDLLRLVATTVHEVFGPRWVAVLLPEGDTLRVAATAGDRPDEQDLAVLGPRRGRPAALGLSGSNPDGVVSVALDVQGRPLGLLAMGDIELDAGQRQRLRLYSGQVARAIERSQLRELALEKEALESSDRWRRALLGGVSHDLRTPLATIKASVSTLRETGAALGAADRDELLELVEMQCDRLTRLVSNLLDASRIQAGALRLTRRPIRMEDLIGDALTALGGSLLDTRHGTLHGHEVAVEIPDGLPSLELDEPLMVQALANVLDNAWRHAPPGTPVTVSVEPAPDHLALAVRDRGPGVPAEHRSDLFEMWTTHGGEESERRAGLGLALCRAFVEAHGGTVRLDESWTDGAGFVITLPVAGPGARDGRDQGRGRERATP